MVNEYIYHVSGHQPGGATFYESFSSKESLIFFIRHNAYNVEFIEKITAENKATNNIDHINYSINECGEHEASTISRWCDVIEKEEHDFKDEHNSKSLEKEKQPEKIIQIMEVRYCLFF